LANEADVQAESIQTFEKEPQGIPVALGALTSSVSAAPGMPGVFADIDLGWRSFLKTLGVSAAIISYVRECGDVGRQAFMVGLDDAREDLRLARALLAHAEQIWQPEGTNTFHPFRLSEQALATQVPALDAQPRATRDATAAQLLDQFDHAAVARYAEPNAKLQALLLRHPEDGEFTTECRQSILRVLPLFMRSAGAFVAARQEERRVAQLEAMFDKVSLATLLVDANGRPIFCNDAARKMLDERNWLLQGPDGTIACRNAALSKQFRNAVRSVATVGDFAATDAVLRLDNEDGEWRLAFIVPAASRFRDESSRCAMVLVHAPERADASAQLLSALGLLPSEQRFLNSFLRSSSLSEAATETGVSDETARTYLKRVRAKLGVHRQMDLAGLISGLVPPIRQRIPAQ
jgi:PAS domain-containing protein/DNA-binding CsgD family transcriptional regulator